MRTSLSKYMAKEFDEQEDEHCWLDLNSADFSDDEEECTHGITSNSLCIGCGKYIEPDDFSGATEGDR